MSANLRAEMAERPIARGIRKSAEVADVSPSFIRKEISAGELKCVRVGRRVLIKDSDLLEWLNRNAESAAA